MQLSGTHGRSWPAFRSWRAATRDALARLADEARAEYLAGRTEALDPDRL